MSTYRVYDADGRELGVVEAFDRYHARKAANTKWPRAARPLCVIKVAKMKRKEK
jgi:hypothetical protein